jgi:Neurobeachin/BDCP, DUF4704 alpha solenoid region/Concanavalin A-like lectin/glucanases superfamily/WD domain, G-beta repeat
MHPSHLSIQLEKHLWLMSDTFALLQRDDSDNDQDDEYTWWHATVDVNDELSSSSSDDDEREREHEPKEQTEPNEEEEEEEEEAQEEEKEDQVVVAAAFEHDDNTHLDENDKIVCKFAGHDESELARSIYALEGDNLSAFRLYASVLKSFAESVGAEQMCVALSGSGTSALSSGGRPHFSEHINMLSSFFALLFCGDARLRHFQASLVTSLSATIHSSAKMQAYARLQRWIECMLCIVEDTLSAPACSHLVLPAVELLERLCRPALTSHQLKSLLHGMRAVRDVDGRHAKPRHWFMVTKLLLGQIEFERDMPRSYFVFDGSSSTGLALRSIDYWPLRSVCFAAWIYIETLQPVSADVAYQPRLLSLLNEHAHGIEIYLERDGRLTLITAGESSLPSSAAAAADQAQAARVKKLTFDCRLPLRQWTFVCVTHRHRRARLGSRARLFVDGAKVASGHLAWPELAERPLTLCAIGVNARICAAKWAHRNAHAFNGKCSTLYVFARSLSKRRVRALYSAGPRHFDAWARSLGALPPTLLPALAKHVLVAAVPAAEASGNRFYEPVDASRRLETRKLKQSRAHRVAASCAARTPRNAACLLRVAHGRPALVAITSPSVVELMRAVGSVGALLHLFGQLDLPLLSADGSASPSDGLRHLHAASATFALRMLRAALELPTNRADCQRADLFRSIGYLLRRQSPQCLGHCSVHQIGKLQTLLLSQRGGRSADLLLDSLHRHIVCDLSLWSRTTARAQLELFSRLQRCYRAAPQRFAGMLSLVNIFDALRMHYTSAAKLDASGVALDAADDAGKIRVAAASSSSSSSFFASKMTRRKALLKEAGQIVSQPPAAPTAAPSSTSVVGTLRQRLIGLSVCVARHEQLSADDVRAMLLYMLEMMHDNDAVHDVLQLLVFLLHDGKRQRTLRKQLASHLAKMAAVHVAIRLLGSRSERVRCWSLKLIASIALRGGGGGAALLDRRALLTMRRSLQREPLCASVYHALLELALLNGELDPASNGNPLHSACITDLTIRLVDMVECLFELMAARRHDIDHALRRTIVGDIAQLLRGTNAANRVAIVTRFTSEWPFWLLQVWCDELASSSTSSSASTGSLVEIVSHLVHTALTLDAAATGQLGDASATRCTLASISTAIRSLSLPLDAVRRLHYAVLQRVQGDPAVRQCEPAIAALVAYFCAWLTLDCAEPARIKQLRGADAKRLEQFAHLDSDDAHWLDFFFAQNLLQLIDDLCGAASATHSMALRVHSLPLLLLTLYEAESIVRVDHLREQEAALGSFAAIVERAADSAPAAASEALRSLSAAYSQAKTRQLMVDAKTLDASLLIQRTLARLMHVVDNVLLANVDVDNAHDRRRSMLFVSAWLARCIERSRAGTVGVAADLTLSTLSALAQRLNARFPTRNAVVDADAYFAELHACCVSLWSSAGDASSSSSSPIMAALREAEASRGMAEQRRLASVQTAQERTDEMFVDTVSAQLIESVEAEQAFSADFEATWRAHKQSESERRAQLAANVHLRDWRTSQHIDALLGRLPARDVAGDRRSDWFPWLGEQLPPPASMLASDIVCSVDAQRLLADAQQPVRGRLALMADDELHFMPLLQRDAAANRGEWRCALSRIALLYAFADGRVTVATDSVRQAPALSFDVQHAGNDGYAALLKALHRRRSKMTALDSFDFMNGSSSGADRWLHSTGLAKRWQSGQMSSLDYLLRLNYASGASFCQCKNYPRLPRLVYDDDNGRARDLAHRLEAPAESLLPLAPADRCDLAADFFLWPERVEPIYGSAAPSRVANSQRLLESSTVSASLHRWIDAEFGSTLFRGKAHVKRKAVAAAARRCDRLLHEGGAADATVLMHARPSSEAAAAIAVVERDQSSSSSSFEFSVLYADGVLASAALKLKKRGDALFEAVADKKLAQAAARASSESAAARSAVASASSSLDTCDDANPFADSLPSSSAAYERVVDVQPSAMLHERSVVAVSGPSRGSLIVVGCWDAGVRVVSASSGVVFASFESQHQLPVSSVASHGHFLATGSVDGTVMVYRDIEQPPQKYDASAAASSSSSSAAAAAAVDDEIVAERTGLMRRMASKLGVGARPRVLSPLHCLADSEAAAVAVSVRDSHTLVAADASGNVMAYTLPDAQLCAKVSLEHPLTMLAHTNIGEVVGYASDTRSLVLLSPRTGRVWRTQQELPATLTCMASFEHFVLAGDITGALVAVDAHTLVVVAHWAAPPSESGTLSARSILVSSNTELPIAIVGLDNGTLVCYPLYLLSRTSN